MRQHLTLAAVTITAGFVLLPLAAQSQAVGTNPTKSAHSSVAAMNDDRIWVHGILDQIEGRFGTNNNTFHWRGEAWAGTDTHRVWFKSEGEVAGREVEDGQQEIYYSRPISPFFDIKIGARYDLDSSHGRGWGALGIEGLAPYFLHVSVSGYVSDQGHVAAKLEGSYDLLLTQRLILQPELEMNLYSKRDPSRRIGAGLSDIDTGVRLRYEITRKFAPYIGVAYQRKVGQTADYAASSGERTDNLSLLVGLRLWF